MSAVVSLLVVPRRSFGRVAANYFSSMAVLLFGLVFYTKLSHFHIASYSASWIPSTTSYRSASVIRFADVLTWLFYAYAVLLIPHYYFSDGRKGRALALAEYFFTAIRNWRMPPFTESVRQAVLSCLVKFFFVPFVVNGLLGHVAVFNGHILTFINLLPSMGTMRVVAFYNLHLHMLLLDLIYVVDFLPFVVAYIVESRLLKNEIKSVDATVSGWVVCLLCYPPFSGALSNFIAWQSGSFAPMYPTFPAWLHLVTNAALLVLFALYASASVSLGWKAGNLTNRGVVETGLYRYVRHPAYVTKNLAWWVAGIPVFYELYLQGVGMLLWGVISLGGWSALYVLRALTEERHLRLAGPDYRLYADRVPYRFIPGVL